MMLFKEICLFRICLKTNRHKSRDDGIAVMAAQNNDIVLSKRKWNKSYQTRKKEKQTKRE